MEKKKEFIIGDVSYCYLQALEKYQIFKDQLLEALIMQYGEEAGNERFCEHRPKLEDVERIIMEYLRIEFTSEMTGKNDIVNI